MLFRSIFVNINNFNRMKDILNTLYNKDIRNILIEKHIHGRDFRVLCYKNNVIDVVERIPPFIIGDGKLSLNKLINIKTKYHLQNELHAIKINHEYLNSIGIDLKYIPKKGEKIVINPVSNFHNGGYPTRIPLSEVHDDNIKMFSSINSILKLNLSGIDFLTPDISQSYKNIQCAVNEVNKFPNLDIHYNADNLKSIDFCKKMLRLYFNIN